MCEAFPYVVSNHVYAGRIFVKHLCVCVISCHGVSNIACHNVS